RLARKSGTGGVWSGGARWKWRDCCTSEEIYRAEHQQCGGIFWIDCGAGLRADAWRASIACGERFGADGQADARAVQGKERGVEAAIRTREENVAGVGVVSDRACVPRAESRGGRLSESGAGRNQAARHGRCGRQAVYERKYNAAGGAMQGWTAGAGRATEFAGWYGSGDSIAVAKVVGLGSRNRGIV